MALLNADGQDIPTNGGMPWQVRALAFIGFPAALAGFLVWMMAGTQAKDIATIKEQMADHVHQSRTHDANNDASDHRQEKLLLRICLNTSKTATDRQGCFQ